VWSSTGERHFSSANPGSLDRGIGCFSMGDGPSEGPAIPCVSLDDFVNSAAAPAGIKCDVEGAEVEVLRGARDMLIRHRPWILCETQSPENSVTVRVLLEELGYTVESLDEIHLFAAP
jgi:FkbM family methyltransferase